ncbi:hypothetical protein ACOZ4I_19020 (plasmid) [Haloarcula salina]|uniref:hypothetical protein n=1 Tax=Haloarcula salina TaxID=1429914 RepID=UPI003C6F659E
MGDWIVSEDTDEFVEPSFWDRITTARFDSSDGADSPVDRNYSHRGADMDQSSRFWSLVVIQTGWMAATLTLLLLFDMWALDLYFILSLNGLLIARVLVAPVHGKPDWWRRLNWLVYLGFALLLYLIVQRFVHYTA